MKGYPQVILFPANKKKSFAEIERRPSVDNLAAFIQEKGSNEVKLDLDEFAKEAEALQERASTRIAWERKAEARAKEAEKEELAPTEEDFEL